MDQVLPTESAVYVVSCSARDIAAYNSLLEDLPSVSRCLRLTENSTLEVDVVALSNQLSHSERFLVTCLLSLVNGHAIRLNGLWRLDRSRLPMFFAMVETWHKG